MKNQPPSGGCVLKRHSPIYGRVSLQPAAFGRLCVETKHRHALYQRAQPAAFGRLCVETFWVRLHFRLAAPAAFGRLCVETSQANFMLPR